jgi:hypothetical protein
VRSVYHQIVEGHLSGGFEPEVARMPGKLVDATIELHRLVMNNFLPSAVKFHYQFNLRELSNVTQGLCRMMKGYYKWAADGPLPAPSWPLLAAGLLAVPAALPAALPAAALCTAV